MLATDLEIASFYTEHFTALTELGRSRFHLSDADAEEIVHNILIASLRQFPRIADPNAWFEAALTLAVQRGASNA